jgi:hypothetical protein
MNDECSNIKREAHEAGDLHYRAMTDYVRTGDGAARRRALSMAIHYRQALRWLLDCYGNLRDRVTGRRKAEAALEYKHLVDKDIEMLEESSS